MARTHSDYNNKLNSRIAATNCSLKVRSLNRTPNTFVLSLPKNTYLKTTEGMRRADLLRIHSSALEVVAVEKSEEAAGEEELRTSPPRVHVPYGSQSGADQIAAYFPAFSSGISSHRLTDLVEYDDDQLEDPSLVIEDDTQAANRQQPMHQDVAHMAVNTFCSCFAWAMQSAFRVGIVYLSEPMLYLTLKTVHLVGKACSKVCITAEQIRLAGIAMRLDMFLTLAATVPMKLASSVVCKAKRRIQGALQHLRQGFAFLRRQ